ncbi:hypothetical protein Tco_1240491 [Tanacetum coccineum]
MEPITLFFLLLIFILLFIILILAICSRSLFEVSVSVSPPPSVLEVSVCVSEVSVSSPPLMMMADDDDDDQNLGPRRWEKVYFNTQNLGYGIETGRYFDITKKTSLLDLIQKDGGLLF